MGDVVMVKPRLDYFLMRGGLLDIDDKYEQRGSAGIITKGSLESYNYPSELDVAITIKLFAPRENKGSQPVPDDFPISWSDGCNAEINTTQLHWDSNVKHWKPWMEKLIEQQIEYDKQQGIASSSISDDLMYQGPTPDFKINKKGNNMPVYTQEMKEAGKAAPIGSKVQIINNSKYDLEYGEDILGLELTVRSNPISTSGRACIQVVEYAGIAYCFETDMIFPFKSKEEIEMEEAKKKRIKELSNKYVHLFSCYAHPAIAAKAFFTEMQENGELAEIILPLESN